jgi:hypothetical protein
MSRRRARSRNQPPQTPDAANDGYSNGMKRDVI